MCGTTTASASTSPRARGGHVSRCAAATWHERAQDASADGRGNGRGARRRDRGGGMLHALSRRPRARVDSTWTREAGREGYIHVDQGWIRDGCRMGMRWPDALIGRGVATRRRYDIYLVLAVRFRSGRSMVGSALLVRCCYAAILPVASRMIRFRNRFARRRDSTNDVRLSSNVRHRLLCAPRYGSSSHYSVSMTNRKDSANSIDTGTCTVQCHRAVRR